MKKIKSLFLNTSVRHWLGLLTLFTLSVGSMNLSYDSNFLYGNITAVPEHAAFDGTVLPIEKAPNWTQLTTEEYSMEYSQIPSSKFSRLPQYRNDYFTFDSGSLVWGNSTHDVIRNTKITYPVPWTGNYELDDSGKGAGSHPAVDIKVPKGTPVYAVANGIITKVSSSSGFGKHIVIKHQNVPDPDAPNVLTTLYSSYSHLDDYFVTEGQVITKGELIGKVGATGTATTNHLHFQLDNSLAPWHPYWPFTSAEAAAQGHGFWDGVNYAVGIDNVYAYTHDPMDWVQRYLGDFEVEEDLVADVSDTVLEPVIEELQEEVSEPETADENHNEEATGLKQVKIEVDSVLVGENKTFKIYLLDVNGNALDWSSLSGEFKLDLSNNNIARLSKDTLQAFDFKGGYAELKLYGDRPGSTQILLVHNGSSYASPTVKVLEKSEVQAFDHFELDGDGFYSPGQPEKIQIKTLDANGELTLGFTGDGAIILSTKEGSGTFYYNGEETDRIFRENLVGGVAEVEFVGDAQHSQSTLVVSYGKKEHELAMTAKLFSDFSEVDTFYPSVAYLFKKGTINGYADGTFKAARTVSRVEGLKLIFMGLDREIKNANDVSTIVRFSDTDASGWYADVLATAYDLKVVEGYADGTFGPNRGVNRVEFLKMLFNSVDFAVDQNVSENPYLDVDKDAWYAPYVQFSRAMNIFPIEGDYFEASKPMSRVEVAELIYRLIMVEQNGGEPYSEAMSS